MTIMPQLPPSPLPYDPENPFVLVPLHQYPEFTFECATLLNSEWPRSRESRLNSLWSCSKSFPVGMVLVQSNERQVVGFCKISLIPSMKQACFVESVVVHREMRGKGLGSLLMKKLEDYVLRRKLNIIYLSTLGQENFYKKLGYDECEPVSLYAFGLNSKSASEVLEDNIQSESMNNESYTTDINQKTPGKNTVAFVTNGRCGDSIQEKKDVIVAPPSQASQKNLPEKNNSSQSSPKKKSCRGVPPPPSYPSKLICRVVLPPPPPPPPPPIPKNLISKVMNKTYMKKELGCY